MTYTMQPQVQDMQIIVIRETSNILKKGEVLYPQRLHKKNNKKIEIK